MKFNFHFGNKQTTVWDYAFWGIVLFSLITILSTKLGVDEPLVWRVMDQIQRSLARKNIIPRDNIINKITINTPELLDQRIRDDVDSAIRRYQRIAPSEAPRMARKGILKALKSSRFSETQRMVVLDGIYYECPGGIIGIRSVWVDKDPNCT